MKYLLIVLDIVFAVIYPLNAVLAASSFDDITGGDTATTSPTIDEEPPVAPNISTVTSSSAGSSTATSSAQSTQSGPNLYWLAGILFVVIFGFFLIRRRKTTS